MPPARCRATAASRLMACGRAACAALLAVGLLAAAVPLAGAGVLFEAPFLPFDVSRSPSSVAIQDLNGDGHPDLVVSVYNSEAVSVLLGNGDGTFGARTDFTTGKNPQSVAVGDLDGDGRADLVVTNYAIHTISVLLGNGDGTFRAKNDFAAGSYPQHVALADVNHDGRLDAVVTNRGANTVSVLTGNGNGTFAARTQYSTGTTPMWVAVGLLDGDANPDLVVANSGAGTVSVLRGNGDGTFQPKTDFSAGAAPRSLALADLNADGWLDLAVANSSPSTVSVLPGNGDGTFGTRTGYAVGANPQGVAVADLNHDGVPDLVTANYSANTASVLLGRGGGTFAARSDYRAGNQPNALAIGDLDGDGDPDLAVTDWFTWEFATVAVLQGNGDGTFGAQRHFATGSDPWALVSGDLDRDGTPDLVTANYGANTVSVLLGNGDATFAPKADYASGVNPVSLALCDFNADGRLDLAIANRGATTVSVLLGLGDGSFAARRDFAVGTSPMAVATGELNRDGWPDLVVVNRGAGTVSVLLGNGDGTFRTRTDYGTGTDPFSAALGDLNGDGNLDVAVVNSSSNTVSILLGNGDGTLQRKTDFITGGQPYSVAIADLNGDTRLDLAVANRGTNSVSVLLGNGDGSFAPRTDYLAGLFPQSVVIKDLDGDGHPDLAVANEQSNSIAVFLGRGDGTFLPKTAYGAGTYARSLVAVDVNEDQGEDLVVACFSMNAVTVLLNAAPPPMANPVTIGPVSGPITSPGSCVALPVMIQRTSAEPVRGFSATVRLSASLRLCGARADEGGYLSGANPNVQMGIVDRGGGVYSIDGAILGEPCGATASSGTLFTLHLASDSSSGTGRVTLSAIALRDCANNGIPARVASPGLATVPILPPDNPVTLGSPAGCVTSADSCVTMPVLIQRTTADPLIGFSLKLQLSPNLRLCGARASEGGYFGSFNPANSLQVLDLGGGLYSVDCAILGSPCGPTASSGTLCLLHLASEAAGGTGTVTPVSVTLRDCDNRRVASDAGPAGAIMIANVRPAAISGLAATQQATGTGSGGTTKISLNWGAVGSGKTVELFRTGFGAYPEYDDAGGSAPAVPTWPPDARWVHIASLPAGSAYEDDPRMRDFWYYAAFAQDECGAVSLPAMTTGTLSYHLGDVSDGVTQCEGNGRVWAEDLSLLGSRYGATLVPGDPHGCLDVGPTSDASEDGLPTTDNRLDFEDLMMFTTNFNQVSGPPSSPARAERDELTVVAPARVVAGQVFTASLRLGGAGNLQGLSARLDWDRRIVEPLGIRPGALVESQGGVVFSGSAGVVDVALVGARERGLAGDGVLATVTFRALAAGGPCVTIASVDARDRWNHKTTLGGGRPAAPEVTALMPAAPNPFRGTTTLAFSLARPGAVELAVFSVDGRRVRTLSRETKEAGTYRPVWTGTDDRGQTVRPGMYYARLVTPDGRFTRALVRVE
jgi:hypothetical protein